MLLIILCFCGNAIAQTGSLRMGIQSPTAASLGKYGEVPVNLYTGTPNISIPLYEVKGRDIELPITLDYHASGNKVETISGWVGLGWALKAGGVITRTVIGQPDEEGNGYYETGDQLYEGTNWSSPSQQFINSIQNGSIDTEPDKFFFSFAGRSGQFVMGPKDLASSSIRTIPHQRIKIEPNFSYSTSQWTVTTEDGTQYIFGEVGAFGAVENTTEYNSSLGNIPENIGISYETSWYLAEIRSPHGDDKVTFSYDSYTVENEMRTYQEKFDNRAGSPEPCVPAYSSITGSYVINTAKLSEIAFAKGKIKFHANTLRDDALSPSGLQQDYQLDTIEIISTVDSTKEQYNLYYSYFSGDKRLRLDSLQNKGTYNTDKPPHRFIYHDDAFPDRTTSNAIDLWGYYNGVSYNNDLIPKLETSSGFYPGADRSVDSDAMDIGILERIEYPTGGYTEFDFEANTYGSISGDTTLTGEASLKSASATSNAQYTQETTFTISGIEPVSVDIEVDFTPDDCDMFGCPSASIYNLSESETVASYYSGDVEESIILDPGNYKLTAYADFNQYAFIYASWNEIVSVNSKIAGGLRIKEIRTFDVPNDTEPKIKTFKYETASNPNDPTRSSGVIQRKPEFHYWYSSSYCAYLSRSSVSKMPLGMTQGSEVGYKEVIVEHNNGNDGKQVYKFTTAEDYNDLDPPDPDVWPFFPYTSRDWGRGLETSTETLDAGDNLLANKTTSHIIEFGSTWEEYRALATSFVNSEYLVYHDYKVISPWVHIDKETSRTSDASNPIYFTEIEKDFIYGDAKHLQPTKIITENSDGQKRARSFEYAHEQYSGMESAHMYSQPYKVTLEDGVGNPLRIDWTLWKQDSGTGHWQPCSKWVGGPGLGTSDPIDPSCN